MGVDDLDWSELSAAQREAAVTLGYTQKTWDNDQEVCDLDWSELSQAQRKAATTLGYTQKTWDEDDEDSETETSERPRMASTAAPSSGPYDCVVIGAGLAGLTCARRLIDSGVPHVVCLEARDRLGGRAFSHKFPTGEVCELGCAWIHGRHRSNRISALVDELGFATVETDWEEMWSVDAQGRDIPDAVIERGESDAEKALARCALHRGKSLGEALNAELAAITDPVRRRAADMAITFEVEMEYAADRDEMCAQYWDADAEPCPGGDHFITGDGYGGVVASLARGVQVLKGAVVEAVSYDGPGAVSVRVRGRAEPILARTCVVTLPLGVLKAGSVAFHPPLPEPKRAAIARLGMGLMNKCALRFERPFWPADCPAVAVDTQGFRMFVPGHSRQPTITAYCTGSLARQLEGESDAQIVKRVMAVLKGCFDKTPAAPAEAVVTRWNSDPFARGSYSFIAVGATPDMRSALAEPVQNKLFWAGEATRLDYPSTAHGAVMSGEQAASEVAAALGKSVSAGSSARCVLQ